MMNDQELVDALQEAFDSAWEEYFGGVELNEKERQTVRAIREEHIEDLLICLKQSLQKRGIDYFSKSFCPKLIELSKVEFLEFFRYKIQEAVSAN